MSWIIGAYVAIGIVTAVAVSEAASVDDPGDYVMATLGGMLWPLFMPVLVLHKLFRAITGR